MRRTRSVVEQRSSTLHPLVQETEVQAAEETAEEPDATSSKPLSLVELRLAQFSKSAVQPPLPETKMGQYDIRGESNMISDDIIEPKSGPAGRLGDRTERPM